MLGRKARRDVKSRCAEHPAVYFRIYEKFFGPESPKQLVSIPHRLLSLADDTETPNDFDLNSQILGYFCVINPETRHRSSEVSISLENDIFFSSQIQFNKNFKLFHL